MKNDICISLCWGGVGYHSCLRRLLHSFLSVTHFCCSTFIWKWRISLSLSSWLMLHIHSFTHAHTWELWRARTHARTPPSLFFNEPKCLIHINLTYWVILLNCLLRANQETRCVRCKHQTVHVWSRNVSYFLGALLQGQSMNEDQPLSPEYW